MSSLSNLVRNLFVRAPLEFLIALLRLIMLIIVLILVLVLKLWHVILWLLRTNSLYPERSEEDCGRIPEVLIRRPDPAIYSQTLLMSQGLPVTWNNPDIWVAPAANPGAIEPDSYHLKADTDYIVFVRAHNASTDAAIGTRVRLVYRPWSFNSPDVTPVETDAGGNEVFKFVDIAPMGSAIAQFSWHTPAVAPGEQQHFCLQAHLFHPLDINLANNMGQENTNVAGLNPTPIHPGDTFEIDVPLFNTGRRERAVDFRFDAYQIDPEDRLELRLERNPGRAHLPLRDRLGHILPTITPTETERLPPREPDNLARGADAPSQSLLGRVDFGTTKSTFSTAKSRYVGFDVLRERILSRDYSLPAGMEITVKDAPVTGLRLTPQQEVTPIFTVTIPGDATPGERIPVNIVAETGDGALLGGVTIFFDIE
jgi:hypothetical protein